MTRLGRPNTTCRPVKYDRANCSFELTYTATECRLAKQQGLGRSSKASVVGDAYNILWHARSERTLGSRSRRAGGRRFLESVMIVWKDLYSHSFLSH